MLAGNWKHDDYEAKNFPCEKLQNASTLESSRSRDGSPGVSSMAKRGTNEGSIFRRKDGRWVGSLNLGWEDGKRKRRHFYAATAAAVREELLKARSDQSRGLPVAAERQTVAKFLEGWLEHTLKARAKPRSIESFTAIVNKHIVPALGRIRLDKLTPQQVQALLEKKREPYKQRTKPESNRETWSRPAVDRWHPNCSSKRPRSGAEMGNDRTQCRNLD